MSSYKIIDIPGLMPLKMFVTSDTDAEQGGSHSPEWMVRMDDVTSSSVEKFEKYTELFGWYGEASRFTGSNVGSSFLNTSASIKHSELVLLIPNGGYTASLETSMNSGRPIEALTIVRLGNIKDTKVILQQIDFTVCRIHSMQQQLDRMVIRTNVATKTNTLFVYDQQGGQKGQMVSYVDYVKNQVKT